MLQDKLQDQEVKISKKYLHMCLAIACVGGYLMLICSIPLLIFFSPVIISTIIIMVIIAKVSNRPISLQPYIDKVVCFVVFGSKYPRLFFSKFFYNMLVYIFPQKRWKIMNYGYALLNQQGKLGFIQEEDQDDRFCYQLYYLMATKFLEKKNLQKNNVLEISCGRGGGMAFIQKYLKPNCCLGIDNAHNQIQFCNQAYNEHQLNYVVGDAQKLEQIKQICGRKFDVILNIQSSHYFKNFRKFIQTSKMFLKNDGFLALADYRHKNDIKSMQDEMQKAGYVTLVNQTIKKKEDITLNVIRALKLDNDRKNKLIESYINKYFQGIFKKFAGVQDTYILSLLSNDTYKYNAYILQLNQQ